MAKKLGFGGLANTNGARDFTGKTAAPVPTTVDSFTVRSMPVVFPTT